MSGPRVRIHPERLDETGVSARLRVAVPPTGDLDARLVIDLYDGTHPVHPEGHLGWWKSGDLGPAATSVVLDLAATGADRARLAPEPFAWSWVNPAIEATAVEHLDVHVVVRREKTGELLFDRVVPWLRSSEARARVRRHQRELLEAPAYVRALAPPPAGLADVGCVHVVAPDVRPGDAIGNLALDVARWLSHHGIPVRLWASHFEGAAIGVIHDVAELPERAGPRDLVFYQHSIGDPQLEGVLALPCAKLVFFQGITPPELIEAQAPRAAALCRLGLGQLPRLAGCDALLAGSDASADVLRAALEDAPLAVCPPTLNLGRFEGLAEEPVALPESGRFLLYVGRFAPHKRIEALLEIFAAYRRLDPACDLVLAGSYAGPEYRDPLEDRIARLPPELGARIHVRQTPRDGQLATLYRACTAYVCASAHEGFCIPLVEAMGFRKPVLAFAAPAVRETLGGAGLLFEATDPAENAAAFWRVLGDAEETARLLASQDARYAELRRAADGTLLGRALARAHEHAALRRTAPPS